MTEDQFYTGLEKLSMVFEKKMKHDLNALIYQEAKGYSDQDWSQAVRKLIDDPQRRLFPRLGEIKKVLMDVATVRREADWQETKAREREEVNRLMEGPQGDSIREENKSKVRDLIQAMDTGSEAVSVLAEAWQTEADREPKDCHPDCDEGLVHTQRDGYWKVGRCSVCKRGSTGYPSVDPVSHSRIMGNS